MTATLLVQSAINYINAQQRSSHMTQPFDEEQIKQIMWNFVAEHMDDIMWWCRKAAKYDENYAEELFSDEVLRMLPGCIERWDRIRSFFVYARSYFFLHLKKKAAIRAMKRMSSYDAIENYNIGDKRSGNELNDVDNKEYIQLLLNHLNEVDRVIVYRSVVLGETTRQIAQVVPYGYTTIALKLKIALSKLREIAESNG